MSAALPGLGKLYAGKPAEAISGFLYVGAMMATTYDFYNRQGLKSPFFIISAGLTSIFYIGNIWGSAMAVNRTKQEFNYEIDQRILLDMHIPLRNLFP
jgi:TM2 domain-containing membrane protein YozV